MKTSKATKKDISQILGIIKINSPRYPIKIAKKEINEMFSKSLNKPSYIVIKKRNELLGFGGFSSSWIDNMIYNIFWVNVSPKYKHKKIGTKIIKDIIKRIKKIKVPKPKMILTSTNIPAFYKKFGFKKINSKYDRDYILMEKRL